MINDTNDSSYQYIINRAKSYLLNLPSKQQFDDLIKQIRLTPLEQDIIIWRYKEFKSVLEISRASYISTATIYNKQRSALYKIYQFLLYKKYIKSIK